MTMKRIVFALTLVAVALFAATLVAQQPGPELVQASIDAYNNKDVAYYEKHLAEDVTLLDEDGHTISGKSSVLGFLKNQLQQAEPQTAKVLITKNGFEPDNLKLKPNVPAKVTFLRQTNDTCAMSVVISEYKIKKDLPLNEPVVVEFKPAKTGNFVFICGMFMVKGQLVVTEQ